MSVPKISHTITKTNWFLYLLYVLYEVTYIYKANNEMKQLTWHWYLNKINYVDPHCTLEKIFLCFAKTKFAKIWRKSKKKIQNIASIFAKVCGFFAKRNIFCRAMLLIHSAQNIFLTCVNKIVKSGHFGYQYKHHYCYVWEKW